MSKILTILLITLPLLGSSFDINKIRKEFKKIESNIALNRYYSRKISQDMQEITIYKKHNRVKKIKVEGGSEDSYHKGEYYFKNGKLFFSYLQSNDVAGCGVEVRNYYKRRHLIKKLVKYSKKCRRDAGYPAYIRSYKELLD